MMTLMKADLSGELLAERGSLGLAVDRLHDSIPTALSPHIHSTTGSPISHGVLARVGAG